MSRPSEPPAPSRAVVLLTGPMEAGARARIEAVADVREVPDTQPQTLREWAADADVLVVRAMLPADIFEHAPRLRGVVRQGVGLDMVPMDSARAHGLPVANVPGSNRHAVAEHVIACIGALTRRIARMDAELHLNGWSDARKLADAGCELFGKTMGIVGLGSIGTRLAEICDHGFGMTVLGYQRRLDAVPAFVRGVSLEELLALSDFVVLACPLTAETRHLIDARRIALMKPGALLVNVARGAVADEAALAEALRERRIAGAALDVFEQQPLAPDHPFLQLHNVLLTPHVAGLTVESMQRMSDGAADEVLRLLRGEPLINRCN